MKNVLYWFIEGGNSEMPRAAQMSLAWMNRNRLLFSQIHTPPPTKHGKWKEIFDFFRNQPMEIVGY
jgi:hypothetical protein